MHITEAMLPAISSAPGAVSIRCADYPHAVLSPAVATEYANRLLRAAAAAEGSGMIEKARRVR